MSKLCSVFPTEYQHEFNKKKISRLEPIRPQEYWPNEKLVQKTDSAEKKSEELVKKLVSDQYHSIYDLHYNNVLIEDEKKSEDSIDFGSELVKYLKNLYCHPPKVKNVLKLPYTTTRVFGYTNPESLHGQFSSYQDTYGRTGSSVILKNVQKMMSLKRKQMVKLKLQSNLES